MQSSVRQNKSVRLAFKSHDIKPMKSLTFAALGIDHRYVYGQSKEIKQQSNERYDVCAVQIQGYLVRIDRTGYGGCLHYWQ